MRVPERRFDPRLLDPQQAAVDRISADAEDALREASPRSPQRGPARS
jgi:hypothetical protein